MSLSDKIKNAKRGSSLFDAIPPGRMHALKVRGRIASAIAQARRDRNMNQSEFAQFCGVTQPMVSRWESGECNLTLDSWAELSYRLSLPFDPMQTPPYSYATVGVYNTASSRPANYKTAESENVINFARYRAFHYDNCKEE